MSYYIIRYSDHPGAAERPASEEATKSWTVQQHVPRRGSAGMRVIASTLAAQHKHVEVYQHKTDYSVLGTLCLRFLDGREVK